MRQNYIKRMLDICDVDAEISAKGICEMWKLDKTSENLQRIDSELWDLWEKGKVKSRDFRHFKDLPDVARVIFWSSI